MCKAKFEMEFPTIINWTCPVPFKGLCGGILHFYSNFNCRVRTDLEKFLNLTLVLENSWNLKKVSFGLESCKIILENMNWSLKNLKYNKSF